MRVETSGKVSIGREGTGRVGADVREVVLLCDSNFLPKIRVHFKPVLILTPPPSSVTVCLGLPLQTLQVLCFRRGLRFVVEIEGPQKYVSLRSRNETEPKVVLQDTTKRERREEWKEVCLGSRSLCCERL